jgi:hypothetical protein
MERCGYAEIVRAQVAESWQPPQRAVISVPARSFSAWMLDARTRTRLSGIVTGNDLSAQTALITIVPIL